MNETFSVAPGGFVESYQPHGFSYVYGIWVDNFSGGWLQINQGGLWVPPYTRGWKATVFPGTTQVTVRSYDFANGVRITGATGQDAQVTLWDEPMGDSEGIDFFDAQTVPLVTYFSDIITGGAAVAGVILPAPTVGRIRVYDAKFMYDCPIGQAPQTIISSLLCQLFANPGLPLGVLNISPSNQSDRLIIPVPGGDLPIGSDLLSTVVPDGVTETLNFSIVVRYAYI
jgi:hypothetical protein